LRSKITLKPAFKLKIDFGSEIGIKSSSMQAVGAHTKDELQGMLVCCVVNFLSKRIGNFSSEVLTLGFKNSSLLDKLCVRDLLQSFIPPTVYLFSD
jgi:tRNA-binding EMAP/Myf-like protein